MAQDYGGGGSDFDPQNPLQPRPLTNPLESLSWPKRDIAPYGWTFGGEKYQPKAGTPEGNAYWNQPGPSRTPTLPQGPDWITKGADYPFVSSPGSNTWNASPDPMAQILKQGPPGYSPTPDWLTNGPTGYSPSPDLLMPEGYSPVPGFLNPVSPGYSSLNPAVVLAQKLINTGSNSAQPVQGQTAEARIQVPFPTADRTSTPDYTLLTGDDLRNYLADTMGPWKDYLDKIYQVGGIHGLSIVNERHDPYEVMNDAWLKSRGMSGVHPENLKEKSKRISPGSPLLPGGLFQAQPYWKVAGDPSPWQNMATAIQSKYGHTPEYVLHEATHGLTSAVNQIENLPGMRPKVYEPSEAVTPTETREYLGQGTPYNYKDPNATLRNYARNVSGYDLGKNLTEIPTVLTDLATRLENSDWNSLGGSSQRPSPAEYLTPKDQQVALEQFWRLDNLLNQLLQQGQSSPAPESMIR